MSEWSRAQLSDLCTRITSGGTPKRSRTDYYADPGEGHAWVKSSELRDGYVSRSEERISDLGLGESSAKLLPPETVLIAMYGVTAGKVGILKIESAVNQAVCGLILDCDRAAPVFIFHTLRSKYTELSGKSAGAAQQNLNAGIIKRFEIDLPDIDTQHRIAAILKAFDELIEINERRIELLEDLARSLYREWFVHFRFPGHEEVTMVESEMGLIPAGWKVAEFSNVAEVIVEGVDPADLESSVPYVGLEHLARRHTTLHRWSSPDSVKSRKLSFMTGDTMFGKIRPYFHKVAWAPFAGVASSDTIVFRAIRPAQVSAFVNAVASSDAFVAASVAGSNGTKMPRANPQSMLAYRLAFPTEELLLSFEQTVRPLLDVSAALVQVNFRLAETRDLLLPRLVTGQLDISEIDLGVLTPAETA